jgi:chromosome segregation ATPase
VLFCLFCLFCFVLFCFALFVVWYYLDMTEMWYVFRKEEELTQENRRISRRLDRMPDLTGPSEEEQQQEQQRKDAETARLVAELSQLRASVARGDEELRLLREENRAVVEKVGDTEGATKEELKAVVEAKERECAAAQNTLKKKDSVILELQEALLRSREEKERLAEEKNQAVRERGQLAAAREVQIAEAAEKEDVSDEVARLQDENRRLNKELQKKENEQKVFFMILSCCWIGLHWIELYCVVFYFILFD